MAEEGKLNMTEIQKDSMEETKEAAEEKEEKSKKPSSGSAFEGLYDKLPDISIRSLDKFIILCVIALILVILAGILEANHIIF